MSRLRTSTVAAISFAFTYLFFFEYLPPFRRVHLLYDLLDFHYPLVDYAFQALRHGRFPEWDPTTYCGLSFAGNVQAALFYPPMWLLFVANVGRPAVSYQSLEDLVIAHVWLAFFLCYLWLRHKNLAELSSVLGAGVFAYSGYMLNQLQHLGLAAGYAWIPLAFWGIDQAIEEQRWRPLWKVAAASALCFLAGYPPTWFVFALCTVSYAAWHWRSGLGAVLAIGASLLIAAVQILPALDANAMKDFEARYGTGERNPEAYISYFLPNYFDFGLLAKPKVHWAGDYLYLGAPAVLGLLCLVRCSRRRELLPSLSVLGVSAVIATNPFGLVWQMIRHSDLLAQICRAWYFLAGFTVAAAPLAAFGLDHCLRQKRRLAPRWLVILSIGLMAAWSARQMLFWFPLNSDFPTGWRSAVEPAITLALFCLGIFILPAQRGAIRTGLTAAVLLTVAVDYKVFGTSKWFDAEERVVRTTYGSGSFRGMQDAVFHQLLAHAEYRIVVDVRGPLPQNLRHYGLTTPQGFDPFVTTQYKKLMTKIARIRSQMEIDMEPADETALELLGVRYVITADGAPLYLRLSANPEFRLLEPSDTFYKVFEFGKARPPYSWVTGDGQLTVRRVRWTPEEREFVVGSRSGGRFALVEQMFPGWQAALDGRPVPIERWSEAFQAVQVPPGDHRLAFQFRSRGLHVGAIISLLASLVLAVVIWGPRTWFGMFRRYPSAAAVPGPASSDTTPNGG